MQDLSKAIFILSINVVSIQTINTVTVLYFNNYLVHEHGFLCNNNNISMIKN